MSSSSGRRADTYALPASNADASIRLTRPKSGMSGGVTFLQFAPPSREGK